MKSLKLFLSITVIILFEIPRLQSQELYSQNNAASITQESNSTIGWVFSNTHVTSDDSSPYHGSYAIRAESSGTSDGDRRLKYAFPATSGEIYNISIWAKRGGQSTDPAFAAWTGVSGFTNPTVINGSTWAEYTFTITATNDTPEISVYTGSGSQGSVGDIIFIDRISIVPQGSLDTQAPTSPILSSSDHSDTTANLSWSGATDNIAVTGYRIFKDGALETTLNNVSTYQVTNLIANTSYSFTATALDALGNESPASNTISITTNSSSGSGGSVWSETGPVASYAGDIAVGTGTVPTGYKMAIDGKLIAEEVKVQLSGNWPDYVFTSDYDLLSLEEIQKHIKEKGHLPNIPSAEEVETNGIELGDMNKLLLEKIEELTLYLIELKLEINTLKP